MTRLVVIFGFLVAFGAGLTVGYRAPRTSAGAGEGPRPTTRPSGRDGWLAAELVLATEQREQLKKIWSESTRRNRGDQDDLRRQYRTERDEAVAALIRPEDKEKYAQAIKTYSDRMAGIDQLGREAYQIAVEQTKAVLTPEQRTKYEEILKRHGPPPQRHTRASTENSAGLIRRTEGRATTRPAGTQPTSRQTP